MLLAYILAFSLLGSAGSLIGAGVLLRYPKIYDRYYRVLMAFAIGALFALTFTDILPEAIDQGGASPVLLWTLLGYLAFFLIEKLIHGHHAQHHHHGELEPGHVPHEPGIKPAGIFVLIGDSLHNFIDGILITATFSISIPFGMVTSLAVFAHEIPHELGDFVILVESGFSKKKAYVFNALSSLTSLAGSLLAYVALGFIKPHEPLILAIAASSFLYIAATNLAPVLHLETNPKASAWQVAGLFGGVAALFLLHQWLGG
ncbi:MAG TPA: ZIP family metal transporter [Oscillatoriaceae cyanobacterium]